MNILQFQSFSLLALLCFFTYIIPLMDIIESLRRTTVDFPAVSLVHWLAGWKHSRFEEFEEFLHRGGNWALALRGTVIGLLYLCGHTYLLDEGKCLPSFHFLPFPAKKCPRFQARYFGTFEFKRRFNVENSAASVDIIIILIIWDARYCFLAKIWCILAVWR